MSLQRQFNKNGITIEEARKRNFSEETGVRRVKPKRPWRSYRSNAHNHEDRKWRLDNMKSKFGIAPPIHEGAAKPRRKPSIYMPHVGGKHFIPRPKKVSVRPIFSLGQLFQHLAMTGKLLQSKRKKEA